MPTRKIIGLLLGPTLYFLVSTIDPPQSLDPASMRVIGTAAWMITWWVLEVLPMPATALLPIILFPLGDVSTVSQATAPYASNVIFLFLGGFIIALALEKHNLHKRIALSLIKLTGTTGNGIILGFMIATAVLSMWISNTATAVMMLPIAISVINLLESASNDEPKSQSFKMFSLGLFLSIAYAANIGGTATIIGTPPNVVMVGFLKQFANYELEFGTWLLLGVPLMIAMLIITYLLITRVLYRNRLGQIDGAKQVIEEHLKKLGPLSKEEKLVTVVFCLTAFGWVFKNQINGMIGSPLLSDTVTAISGGVLMFLTPTRLSKSEFILDWEDTMKLPWGILLLFGGGMSLAKGMEATGLVHWIGGLIASQPDINPILLILILTGSMLYLTELMSNVALATIYIPVVIGIAEGLDMDPVLLTIPVAIASSYAFMMPISTPPNAIVFASGHIKMRQMMRAGFLLNILAILLLVLASQTLIKWIYS